MGTPHPAYGEVRPCRRSAGPTTARSLWDREHVQIESPEVTPQRLSSAATRYVASYLEAHGTVHPAQVEFFISVLEADSDVDNSDLAVALMIPAVAVALFATAMDVPSVGIFVAAGAGVALAIGFGLVLLSRVRAGRRQVLLIRLYEMRLRGEMHRRRRQPWWRRSAKAPRQGQVYLAPER